jgi:hypothetical protein
MPRLFHVRAEKAQDKLHKKNMQNLCIPTKFMPSSVDKTEMQKGKQSIKTRNCKKNSRFWEN